MAGRVRTERAFCRICLGHCGMVLEVDEAGAITKIRGDKDNPITRGYACYKGLQAEDAHHGPNRLLHPLRKTGSGSYANVQSERALDEIAEKLRRSIEEHGPDSVGVYFGNGSIFNSTAVSMQAAFLDAIGSRSRFTSYTIDQSAKTLSFERLGGWAGGTLQLEQSEVILLIGTNPLLSHGLLGFLASDPTKRLKEAKAAGLKMIVIDPRHTETAGFADLAIQPLPGHDPAILAGLIRLVLKEGWHDRAFCDRYVSEAGMRRLADAVEPFREREVENMTGLNPRDLRAVAQLFARDCKQGAVYTGTGPSMAPHSNLMQHMADCLNVICGRYTRAGDRVMSVDMLSPAMEFRAEVIPPSRDSWNAPPSRIRGVGCLAGEKTTGTLPDEILTPGDEQVRCLISCGGNLASLMPDQQKAVKAFRSLDMLVVIDPYMSNTARIADYVIPPRMQYERADLPVSAYGFAFFPAPWTGYSPAILNPPAGSDVMEEWYFFWALAKRLGVSLKFCGVELDRDIPPTTDDLLAIRAQNKLAPLEEIKKYPSGKVFDEARTTVLPPREEANATFDVMPDDVFEEVAEIASTLAGCPAVQSRSEDFSFRLSTRRMRHFYNSIGLHFSGSREKNPYNPAFLNPDDMAQLGLVSGDRVVITSDHASIEAIAEKDEALRRGVVSMAVGWGGLPDEDIDPALHGASTNMLISTDRDCDPVNSMPRMSAIPVNLKKSTRNSLYAE